MPNKKGQPTENEIQSAIRDDLSWKGWYVIRIQQGMGAHNGLSDLIAIKNGRVVFIEVKTPRGKQSEYQIKFEEEITKRGAEYIVMRSAQDVAKIETSEVDNV